MYARKWISAVVFFAVMAWLVVGVLADPTEGEGGSEATAEESGQQKIAMLDVAAVMKDLTWLKKQMEEIHSDAKEIRAALKPENEEVLRKAEHARSLGAAAPNREEMQKELIAAQAALQTKVKVKEQELRMREAKAYSAAYDTMSKEAKEYVQANGFSMVLRVANNLVDDGSQKAVISKLNQPVVWYDSKYDITSVILARLNAVDGPL